MSIFESLESLRETDIERILMALMQHECEPTSSAIDECDLSVAGSMPRRLAA